MSAVNNDTRLERLQSLLRRTKHDLASARRRDARYEAERLDLLRVRIELAIEAESPRPPKPPKPKRREPVLERMAELGVDAKTIRTWALTEGLTKADRGRLGAALVEAWAEAHPRTPSEPREDTPA